LHQLCHVLEQQGCLCHPDRAYPAALCHITREVTKAAVTMISTLTVHVPLKCGQGHSKSQRHGSFEVSNAWILLARKYWANFVGACVWHLQCVKKSYLVALVQVCYAPCTCAIPCHRILAYMPGHDQDLGNLLCCNFLLTSGTLMINKGTIFACKTLTRPHQHGHCLCLLSTDTPVRGAMTVHAWRVLPVYWVPRQ
jgi:hypothetical protein